MARTRSTQGDAEKAAPAAGVAWTQLTWGDLEAWAGSGAVARGRAYQRGGRVSKLAVAADGALLATVRGTERYATEVTLDPGQPGTIRLESSCTCPVSVSCKHAVAVVAEYLQAIADGIDVPAAPDDDPRREEIEAAGAWLDDEPDEDDYDEDDAPPRAHHRRARATSATASAATGKGDAKRVEAHLRGLSREELADFACDVARRFPAVRDELRERLAFQEGDAQRLIAEARREIRKATANPGWRNHWEGAGYTPDYGKVRHRLERLLELGRADDVVALGREFVKEGLRQVGTSHDEGETETALAEALPVVFRAVLRSSLSPPEQLLFAIDTALGDNINVTDEATEIVLDETFRPEDWSAVADALAARLAALPVSKLSGLGSFSRDYQRDRLSDWVSHALEEASRGDEVTALYEAEARRTLSYERLVSHLIEAGRDEDAERWAREGIAATWKDLPGIADQLVEQLGELAERRGQWDVVAAHAARRFFDKYPSVAMFGKLIEASRQAGVEAPVRAAALRFLETGQAPYRVVVPKASPVKPAAKPKGKGKAAAAKPGKGAAKAEPAMPPGGTRVAIDADWPLPVPDELIPLLERPRWGVASADPHLGVLLELAMVDRRPDEVLQWYDRMRAANRKPGGWNSAAGYADRVAEAVAETHPGRALEILTTALEAQLPRAEPSAYEAAAGYLRKLRPLYESLGRAEEWPVLVASIRERYRNRPRFLEVLDRLEGAKARTIVQESQARQR